MWVDRTYLAGSCPRRAAGGGAAATTFYAQNGTQSQDSEGPLAGLIGSASRLQRPTTSDGATFVASSSPLLLLPNSSAPQYYMVNEVDPNMPEAVQTQDPLQANDPWGRSQASSTRSMPTSAPRSYGPARTQASSFFPEFITRGFRRQQETMSEPPMHNPPMVTTSASSATPRTVEEMSHFPPEPERSPPLPGSAFARRGQATFEAPPPSVELPRHQPRAQASHDQTMAWANMANMPEELRQLMPWPVFAPPPQIPAFAQLPQIEFLGMTEPPDLPLPETLRMPQRSTLEGPLRGQVEEFFQAQRQVQQMKREHVRVPNMPQPVQVQSQVDPQFRPELQELHQAQVSAEQQRHERKQQRRHQAPVQAAIEHDFDGTADKCMLCQELFSAGDAVLRLVCRHVYHVTCWTNFMIHGERLHCPMCRGIVARYNIPRPGVRPDPEAEPEMQTPVTTPRSGLTGERFNIFTPPPRHTREEGEGTPVFSPEATCDSHAGVFRNKHHRNHRRRLVQLIFHPIAA